MNRVGKDKMRDNERLNEKRERKKVKERKPLMQEEVNMRYSVRRGLVVNWLSHLGHLGLGLCNI